MKSLFSKAQFFPQNFAKKLTLMLLSLVVLGVALAGLIEVGWGSDPSTFMCLNVSHVIHWQYGNWVAAISTVLFVFVLIFARETVGFSTFANMFLIGYLVQFSLFASTKFGFHDFVQNCATAPKIAIFAAAIATFVVAAAFFLNADLGVPPYDAIPLIIAKRLPNLPFIAIRMCFDWSIIAIGFAASRFSSDGMQGSLAGSVVVALTLGPMIGAAAKIIGKFL